MATATTVTTTQQPVVFTTRTEYAIPSQQYMLPTGWRRFQLSQLINRVLNLPQPVPFDFLVRGELLHGTLAEWCAERGVGEEETIEIEYFEATVPPQKAATLPHEDWVAGIDCRQTDRFVTASYDGAVRVFSASQELLHTIESSAPVLSAVFVQPTILASGGHERAGRLTRLTDSGIETYASLVLHTAPISNVCTTDSGDRIVTSGWDGLLGVWDTSAPDDDQVPSDMLEERERGKKRRRVDGGSGVDDRPKRKAPLEVLKGHTARVSQAAFASSGVLYSTSHDSTIRSWDIHAGVSTRTVSTSEKPFTALALPTPNTLLAASTDRTLNLLDLRSASSVPAAGFGHPALPTSLAAHPTDGVRVASGGADGVVRVWDVRSTKEAVSSFTAWNTAEGNKTKGGKILGISWGPNGVLGVAGEAGVEIWRMRDGSGVTQ